MRPLETLVRALIAMRSILDKQEFDYRDHQRLRRSVGYSVNPQASYRTIGTDWKETRAFLEGIVYSVGPLGPWSLLGVAVKATTVPRLLPAAARFYKLKKAYEALDKLKKVALDFGWESLDIAPGALKGFVDAARRRGGDGAQEKIARALQELTDTLSNYDELTAISSKARNVRTKALALAKGLIDDDYAAAKLLARLLKDLCKNLKNVPSVEHPSQIRDIRWGDVKKLAGVGS